MSSLHFQFQRQNGLSEYGFLPPVKNWEILHKLKQKHKVCNWAWEDAVVRGSNFEAGAVASWAEAVVSYGSSGPHTDAGMKGGV